MRWGEIIRRLVLIPPTLFGVAVIVFVLLRVVPGDPIAMMIPPGATPADIDRLRAFYGLDQPLLQQFVTWFGQALSGNFGRSISLHQRVFELVLARLPATLELALLATLIAVALGLAAALIGIQLRGRRTEWAVDGAIGVLLAIPDFLWALILLLLFGVLLPWLPISGRIDPQIEIGRAHV
jgi:ABC-type dipeptide/oligopeptide/nickel transport system permease component